MHLNLSKSYNIDSNFLKFSKEMDILIKFEKIKNISVLICSIFDDFSHDIFTIKLQFNRLLEPINNLRKNITSENISTINIDKLIEYINIIGIIGCAAAG